MPEIPRFLITTADERTWKFDCPVIFLGEWCRLYDRKHIWQDMDAIVCAPYGLGQAKKDADHAEARRLEEKLFPILCEALNQHHGSQHSARFWRTVLGFWLRRFVDLIFNRVKTLESCLQGYQLSSTIGFSDDQYMLATMDSYAAYWATSDDRWNNALYLRILKLIGDGKCPVELIPGCESEGFCWSVITKNASLKGRIMKLGYHLAGRIARLLARKNDAFIINSYLPQKEEIKLQLLLGQVPQLWFSPKFIPEKKPDRELRQSLSTQLFEKTTKISLFDVMCALAFELLPVCYLEGFPQLSEQVKQLPWPKHPKFIFTSNNYDTDEVFKLWTATKIEANTPYIIGQHGNNYGTHRYKAPTIAEEVADKFLTWGWTDSLSQHTAAFIFKNAGGPADSYNPNGGLLLVEFPFIHRLTIWDQSSGMAVYMQEQQAFINNLDKSPRENVTIRLHAIFRHFKWAEDIKWNDFAPELKIDTGEGSIRKLIAQSRLVVHSYDSTGILETLSQNIPTLAFWQDGFEHLRESANPHYQLLVNAGIFHLTPESVAAKVNEVWDDVDSWWGNSSVQEARKQFCQRYAKVSQNPARELEQILSDMR